MTVATRVPLNVRAAAMLELRRRELGADNAGYHEQPRPTMLAWHEGAWGDTSLVHLYTGSAGGGKSWLAATKLHHYMLNNPGAMGLMIRKTRESMNNSTVLFFAQRIIKGDNRVKHLPSQHRFEYVNGSILAYGGMKDEEQREQVRSIGLDGGVDIVWVEEANKIKLEDYQELLPRLRGKAGAYRQIILTTNPDSPSHWIYTRLIGQQEAKVWYSSALDNTYNPPDYITNLNMLTGVQRLRLVEGQWVQAEGAVFDNWSHENIDDTQAVYDPDRPVLYFCDDGYQNPRVVLVAQIRHDGSIVLLDEYYKAHQLFDQTIADLQAFPYRKAALAIYDPAASTFAAELRRAGIQTMAANNDIAEGLKVVRDYIADGNGVRSLFVSSRCPNLIREIPSYTYDDTNALKGGDPKPVKENDHTCDALRYGLATNHGLKVPKGGFRRVN